MKRAATFALLLAAPIALPALARADPEAISISISAGALESGLESLERQTGAELLFDPGTVRGVAAPAVSGALTTEAALHALLAQSNLVLRRAQSGAWIVESSDAAPLAQPDVPVFEILVIGHPTQNADIRRFETDIQPYEIDTRDQIIASHRDNIEQYFASRVTPNTAALSLFNGPGAEVSSAIDLRGLGGDQTLILVDGRRMPSVFGAGGQFGQADLNAIPLHSISRIETLTGTAGGIYGFGALGGVVNVVLDRSNRGLDLHVTGGVTQAGDSPRHSLEASYGATSNDGQTDVSFFAAHAEAETPLAGQRDFTLRDRRETLRLALGAGLPAGAPFQGNSISVSSFFGDALQFKPGYGGALLSSNFTYLPLGFAGNNDALTSALTQHQGQVDLSLPAGDAKTDLGANPHTDSLFFNLRHRFVSGLEIYGDAIWLKNQGRSFAHDEHSTSGSAFLEASSPANPFTNEIDLTFPVAGLGQEINKRVQADRYTLGMIAPLPFDWRATAELSAGAFNYSVDAVSSFTTLDLFLLGASSDLDTNPLGNWNAFTTATAGLDQDTLNLALATHTRFRDQTLRLGGPLFTTAAGPTTVTLLAERQSQHAPSFIEHESFILEGDGENEDQAFASGANVTTSFYGELHANVFGQNAPFMLLRGLEIQAAIRRDKLDVTFDRNAFDDDISTLEHVSYVGTSYTLGAKATPASWLMLRGSFATGQQPPSLFTLGESSDFVTDLQFLTDPERGNTGVGADGLYTLRSGGRLDMPTVRANTLFVGTVISPLGPDGPTFSVDYSHIVRTHDYAILGNQQVIDHESLFPGRVERGPLTDSDRALGYTGGPITLIDTRIAATGRLDVNSVDARALWPIEFMGGRLHLYLDATYYIRNLRTGILETPLESANYRGGPLTWRANGGFAWSNGEFSVGANAQYFSSYFFAQPGDSTDRTDFGNLLEGNRRVPAQPYLDMNFGWRPAAAPDIDIDFGIVNVFDTDPPREAQIITGGSPYSSFGDPRLRRFELTLSAHF